MTPHTRLACACGQFSIALAGAPFIAAECHCASCREAARRFAALPVAFPPVGPNGGTPYLLYQKNRIGFPDGTRGLVAYRLSEKAPTRRVVTACCNSPVFLEFQGGHWLSIYANLWPAKTRPDMDIRTMTADLPEGHALDSALPSGKATTAGFYARLLLTWIAMGFKVPKIDLGESKVLGPAR